MWQNKVAVIFGESKDSSTHTQGLARQDRQFLLYIKELRFPCNSGKLKKYIHKFIRRAGIVTDTGRSCFVLTRIDLHYAGKTTYAYG